MITERIVMPAQAGIQDQPIPFPTFVKRKAALLAA